MDPEKQGRGIGRGQLETIHKISYDRSSSTGVYLNTENPGNVDLYKHMGYTITHGESFSDVVVWYLFLPDAMNDLI